MKSHKRNLIPGLGTSQFYGNIFRIGRADNSDFAIGSSIFALLNFSRQRIHKFNLISSRRNGKFYIEGLFQKRKRHIDGLLQQVPAIFYIVRN